MRVLLADDHALVRAGIRALLERIGETVIAETGDGREAIDLIDDLKPDAALLDITMPGLNGFEVAARIAKSSPHTRVVILSMHADPAYVAQAMRAGVCGYLLKDGGLDELRVALRAVSLGQTYLSPGISTQLVDRFARQEQPNPLAALTERQREILQLIAESKSMKEIAAALGVSIKTVETHRAQMMERLNIHDVAGLVRFAVRAGVVSA